MNIVVCIKQVPDTETKINISNGELNTSGYKWVMNPYDEYAVEEAIQFKTKNAGAKEGKQLLRQQQGVAS